MLFLPSSRLRLLLLTTIVFISTSMLVYSQTDYCDASSPERTDESWIIAFSIEGTTEPIDLEWTEFPENGYVFDENLIVEHYAGGTLYYELQSGTSYHTLTAYVDTNQNYIFDSDEMIFTANSVYKNSGEEFTIDPNLPNGDYRVRIRLGFNLYNPIPPCGVNGFGSTLDFTLRITDPPSCIAPYNVNIDYRSINEAQISWNTSDNSTSWILEYGEPGNKTEININTNPYILTNLDPETEYEIKVRTTCGGNNSGWTNNRSFSTLCTAMEIPYQLDLTNATLNELPDCYNAEQESKRENWEVIDHYLNGKVLGNTEELVIRDWESWLYTPPIHLEAGENYILSFETAAYNTILTKERRSVANNEQDLLEITFGKKPFNESMNTILQEATYTYSEDFETTELLFEVSETDIYYFGFHTINFQNSLFLDNIHIDKSMSVPDYRDNNKIILYPNPAFDVVHIHSESEIQQVILYNLSGQKIISSEADGLQTQLDLSNLQSGTYFIQITTITGIQSLQLLKE